MKAVILAGGKGTRLRPYTISLPKPLMPVGHQPILEFVVRKLREAGFEEIVMAVGYLESLIRAYFGDGGRFGIPITYSIEEKPLGTAGPLGLVRDRIEGDVLVMNGDVLTDLDLEDFLSFHRNGGAMATVGIVNRSVDIDFGVVRFDDANRFVSWEEKPTHSYLVSMGIHVFRKEALDLLPEGFFNLPDLIVKIHESGGTVSGYLHEGFWLDIGRLEDYKEACRLFEEEEKDFGC